MKIDVALIAALIAATTSIIGILIKLYAQFKSKSLTYRERKQKQLTEIFEPIEKVFFINPDADPNWQFSQIFDIVKVNLHIVPVNFFEEVKACRNQKDLTKDKLDELHNKASLYYNELKRILGYPYIKPQKTFLMRLKFVLELLVERCFIAWLALFTFILGLILFVVTLFLTDTTLFSLSELHLISLGALVISIISFLALLFADSLFEYTDS